MQQPNTAKQYLKLFSNMEKEKNYFIDIAQDVDKYIFGQEISYTSNPVAGRERYKDVYDQTAMKSVKQAKSALAGILWKRKGFKVIPSEELAEDQQAQQFFEKSTEKFRYIIENADSNFEVAFNSSLEDDFTRGSTAIGVYRSNKVPLIFKNHKFRFIFFQENADGVPDTVCIRTWLPIYKVAEKYGFDNMTKDMQEKCNDENRRDEEVEILHFVLPNEGKDKEERPYKSVHIARQDQHVLKDSWYEERQVIVSRFWADEWSAYGTCPGMDNIMTVKRLNKLKSTLLDGIDRSVLPPLAFAQDAFGETLDLSASAANPYDPTALNGVSPVEQISTVGDLSAGAGLYEQEKLNISNLFYVDMLIDFSNATTMTATEFIGRETIRASALNDLIVRQVKEKLTPLLETSFNLLFNDNYFGYVEGSEAQEKELIKAQATGIVPTMETIPESIVKLMDEGKPLYQIVYTTPAARLLQAEELENTQRMVALVANLKQVKPDIDDNIDFDEMIRDSFDNAGLEDQLVPMDQVKEIRTQRTQMQMQQQQLANQQAEANIAATGGQ